MYAYIHIRYVLVRGHSNDLQDTFLLTHTYSTYMYAYIHVMYVLARGHSDYLQETLLLTHIPHIHACNRYTYTYTYAYVCAYP